MGTSPQSPTPRPPPPPPDPPPDVTRILLDWGSGDKRAGEELLPVIYAELHRQAERAMRREAPEHTLQPTALVHEAYLRLVNQKRVAWQNRAHFFGIAAQMMRRVLVDHARGRRAAKRGGEDNQRITLSGIEHAAAEDDGDVDILELHEALERLAVLDADQAKIVELRYFAGLTIEETAEAMSVSAATIKREWATARAWLKRELTRS